MELFLGVGPGCRWLLPWVCISYGLGPILHLGLRALPWVAPSLPSCEGSAHLCVHVVRQEVVGLLHLNLVAHLGPHVCPSVRAE
jgi:hypothetical protein